MMHGRQQGSRNGGLGGQTPTSDGSAGSQDFDLKLRLILRTLEVSTQKELHALVKQVNPDTGFSPERAYKWIAGRSSPRDHSIYDDLARLLELSDNGQSVSGDGLRRADFPTFYAWMLERFGERVSRDMAPGTLPYREQGPDSQTSLRPQPNAGRWSRPGHRPEGGRTHATELPMPGYVLGSYLSFSPAWSTYNRGLYVLGAVTISRLQDGGVLFQYEEPLPGGMYVMRGPLSRYGRCLETLITEPDGEDVISMVFAVPGSFGLLLSGLMSGVPPQDTELRPVVGRILCIDSGCLPGLGDLGPGESAAGSPTFLDHWWLETPADVTALLTAAGASRPDQLADRVWEYITDQTRAGLMSDSKETLNDIAGLLMS